jgi:hypothetical protein
MPLLICVLFLIIVNASTTIPAALAEQHTELLSARFVFSPDGIISPAHKVFSDGFQKYTLSLEPDFDVYHRIVVLTLVMHHVDEDEDAQNLLDPSGRAHGYQKYIFAASDFANGPERSVYGESRSILIDSLGLLFNIGIRKAIVEKSAEGTGESTRYKFDEFILDVKAERKIP